MKKKMFALLFVTFITLAPPANATDEECPRCREVWMAAHPGQTYPGDRETQSFWSAVGNILSAVFVVGQGWKLL